MLPFWKRFTEITIILHALTNNEQMEYWYIKYKNTKNTTIILEKNFVHSVSNSKFSSNITKFRYLSKLLWMSI